MKCKYCLTEFFEDETTFKVPFKQVPKMKWGTGAGRILDLQAATAVCPSCSGPHLRLRFEPTNTADILDEYLAVPLTGAFPPAPAEVPSNIAIDYEEANRVLPFSPKASAALSRRCLQAVLAGAGYVSKNLAQQVQEAIDETSAAKALPPAVRDSLDAIRNFGNFSAHPLTDISTSQIIEVEAGEAEWCLELLLELFDHYYVRPAKAAARRAALATKLTAAGKPPMKTGSP